MAARIGLWEHFRKLATFGGREDRASFWPYAALALGIAMVAAALMALPLMAWTIQAAPPFNADPGDLNVFEVVGNFSIPAPAAAGPVLPVDLLSAYLAATLGLSILLYAAAVCRRLHDRGWSGLWGLMPLPFVLYVLVQSVRMIDSLSRGEQPNSMTILTVATASLLYWATLLALILLLAGASEPGPNRYDSQG
jgi:uncharacterized membrane protein YhaH (DUF805 family)